VPAPILFLSDYGLDDEFVGVCHAVIAAAAPDVRVIDLSHGIPPRDIRRGAVALADAVPFAPSPAIYLAVVDPGVGTTRLPVAVEAADSFLVGPDNGLLSLAWEALGGASRAAVIDSEDIVRLPMSETFHGRDVFAPAAAHLASGGSFEVLGSELDPAQLKRIHAPATLAEPGRVRCEVIGIDRFGNLQLSARSADLQIAGLDSAEQLDARIGSEPIPLRRVRTFGHVPEGMPALIVDSSGRLAIVMNHGSAAAVLNLRAGDPVEIGAREAMDSA
jgi:S-adenosylmethionine hydrolase